LTYYTLFCPPFVGVQQLAFQIPAELEMDPDSTTAYLIITQGDQQTPEVAFPLSPAKQ
jgi:hypothetical protein